jgi:hypothetical protein
MKPPPAPDVRPKAVSTTVILSSILFLEHPGTKDRFPGGAVHQAAIVIFGIARDRHAGASLEDRGK